MLASSPKSTLVSEIERLGFKWSEDAQFDISKLDDKHRVQVRESEHYAPRDQVSQYAIQMRLTVFPPIVVSKNNWLVDGNTRVGAKRALKENFIPAIVVDANYPGTDQNRAMFEALAATLNNIGGQRLTPREAAVVAKKLAAIGWKPDQICRALGIKQSLVSGLNRELIAEAKFAKVGFTNGDKLSQSQVRTFGSANVAAINDVPFKGLADLAVEANLNTTEIRDIAKEMATSGSDAAQIDLVDKKRAEMDERIKEHTIFGNGKPAAAARIRRVLGQINTYATSPERLVEKTEAAMEGHLEAVTVSIDVLTAVKKLQEELING